jgi:hypothetical protein
MLKSVFCSIAHVVKGSCNVNFAHVITQITRFVDVLEDVGPK